jgi:hypothetical protein
MIGIHSSGDRRKILLGVALLVAFFLLLAVYFINATCLDFPGTGSCRHILFIGNSYTYVNDLPHVFGNLSRSGGHRVETGMDAQGGWTLTDHLASSATLDQMKSKKWDFVILQEQSEIPSIDQSRSASLYPATRQLVNKIEGLGGTPMLFMTWAHLDGLPANGLPDYQSMQFEIERGYLGIAQELDVPVAPVGYAWLIAHGQDAQLDLWQADGSHPTEQGTYLAACVFYAAIFQQSPAGLKYLDRLPPNVAMELQIVAANIVLNDPKQWNLP